MSPDGTPGSDASAAGLVARSFLADHPEVATIDILLPDISGVVRGKRIGSDQLVGLFEDGAAFPASVFGTDVTGDSIEASGLVWSLGGADYACWPVPATVPPGKYFLEATSQRNDAFAYSQAFTVLTKGR